MEGQKLNMTASIELLEDRIFELDAALRPRPVVSVRSTTLTCDSDWKSSKLD